VTKIEQAEGNPFGEKTYRTRAEKKTFAAGKETCATRKSSGYSAAKKSFGSVRASAKPVK
jgi:hypothetical protein